ncbi:hypothetical protein HELRODRAFT_165010 [Helobdella robusta]|uniref:Uncharacterized protein n=1 Tax=Helobdella robusta TaxID=6412 RepID=T1EW45_HELRO|nr:hypothetical protein HELRODRAFT_165010 [Helobdella robusta]ESN92877.1 hypothetical protein HELRODRAFT_165010 [Helobdella robusta]
MMLVILRYYDILAEIVAEIRMIYDSSTSIVFVGGEQSKEFYLTAEVLQRNVLPPFLYIFVIGYLPKHAEAYFGYINHSTAKQDQSFDNKTSLKHNGENIEKVKYFKNLGSYLGTAEKDLDARIALTRNSSDCDGASSTQPAFPSFFTAVNHGHLMKN